MNVRKDRRGSSPIIVPPKRPCVNPPRLCVSRRRGGASPGVSVLRCVLCSCTFRASVCLVVHLCAGWTIRVCDRSHPRPRFDPTRAWPALLRHPRCANHRPFRMARTINRSERLEPTRHSKRLELATFKRRALPNSPNGANHHRLHTARMPSQTYPRTMKPAARTTRVEQSGGCLISHPRRPSISPSRVRAAHRPCQNRSNKPPEDHRLTTRGRIPKMRSGTECLQTS